MRETIESHVNAAAAALAAIWTHVSGILSDLMATGADWVRATVQSEPWSLWAARLDWTVPERLRQPTGQELAVSLVFVILAIWLWKRSARKGGAQATLATSTRRPRLYGFGAIAFLVLFIGGWSVLAPLSSATLAPGVVSPEGSRKTVEHLEGGIVRTIHIKEGDIVAAGAPLVTLEDIQAKAQYTQLRKRYLHLLALEARLTAERGGSESVKIPAELAVSAEPEAESVLDAQLALFESGRATEASRFKILRMRIRQIDEQNKGLMDVLAAQKRQIALLEDEIFGVAKLYEDGLERRPRLLALQRAQAELEAEQASNRARISENDQKIGETEIQLLTMREQTVEEANEQLAEAQRLLAELRSQMPSREDILHRTVVRAPLSGTVMNIRPTTESGIIRPGEPILEIVPLEVTLIVDAKVRPSDIDRVHEGMQARILLTAYRQRNLPLIYGTLQSVSADRLVEDRTGEPYFLARVRVNPEDLQLLGDLRMVPGMPAEVMLLDGEQTLLSYLLDPLAQSFEQSFREN